MLARALVRDASRPPSAGRGHLLVQLVEPVLLLLGANGLGSQRPRLSPSRVQLDEAMLVIITVGKGHGLHIRASIVHDAAFENSESRPPSERDSNARGPTAIAGMRHRSDRDQSLSDYHKTEAQASGHHDELCQRPWG
eukprot:3384239-Lingulodinium_polyedra.AAC.1